MCWKLRRPGFRRGDRDRVGSTGAGNWRGHGASQGQPRGSKLDAHADSLLGLIAADAAITLKEMQDRLSGERAVAAGIGTKISQNRAAMQAVGLAYVKTEATRPRRST